MMRKWIEKHGEYPFKVYNKEDGKEINVPITERLTKQLEIMEKVIQLHYFLELVYGMSIEIQWDDLDTTLELLHHLEEILKND